MSKLLTERQIRKWIRFTLICSAKGLDYRGTSLNFCVVAAGRRSSTLYAPVKTVWEFRRDKKRLQMFGKRRGGNRVKRTKGHLPEHSDRQPVRSKVRKYTLGKSIGLI